MCALNWGTQFEFPPAPAASVSFGEFLWRCSTLKWRLSTYYRWFFPEHSKRGIHFINIRFIITIITGKFIRATASFLSSQSNFSSKQFAVTTIVYSKSKKGTQQVCRLPGEVVLVAFFRMEEQQHQLMRSLNGKYDWHSLPASSHCSSSGRTSRRKPLQPLQPLSIVSVNCDQTTPLCQLFPPSQPNVMNKYLYIYINICCPTPFVPNLFNAMASVHFNFPHGHHHSMLEHQSSREHVPCSFISP